MSIIVIEGGNANGTDFVVTTGRARKYRCHYPFKCGPYDRHCYDIVAINDPDPPGHCNDDADGEDPDWKPDVGDGPGRSFTPEEARVYRAYLAKIWADAPRGLDWEAMGFKRSGDGS